MSKSEFYIEFEDFLWTEEGKELFQKYMFFYIEKYFNTESGRALLDRVTPCPDSATTIKIKNTKNHRNVFNLLLKEEPLFYDTIFLEDNYDECFYKLATLDSFYDDEHFLISDLDKIMPPPHTDSNRMGFLCHFGFLDMQISDGGYQVQWSKYRRSFKGKQTLIFKSKTLAKFQKQIIEYESLELTDESNFNLQAALDHTSFECQRNIIDHFKGVKAWF